MVKQKYLLMLTVALMACITIIGAVTIHAIENGPCRDELTITTVITTPVGEMRNARVMCMEEIDVEETVSEEEDDTFSRGTAEGKKRSA